MNLRIITKKFVSLCQITTIPIYGERHQSPKSCFGRKEENQQMVGKSVRGCSLYSLKVVYKRMPTKP